MGRDEDVGLARVPREGRRRGFVRAGEVRGREDAAAQQDLQIAIELSKVAMATMQASKCPNDFLCPITLELMDDPVILAQSEQTYERKAIQHALIERPGVDPKTNARFEGEPQLIPNIQLRGVIEQWRRQFVGGGGAAAAVPDGDCAAAATVCKAVLDAGAERINTALPPGAITGKLPLSPGCHYRQARKPDRPIAGAGLPHPYISPTHVLPPIKGHVSCARGTQHLQPCPRRRNSSDLHCKHARLPGVQRHCMWHRFCDGHRE